jgi:hypothetical protein
MINLFITGFLQVFFVVANTYFIAHNNIPGIIFASFLISYTWSHNVKKVAFGTEIDRLIYSLGAMCGAISGYLLAGKIT